MTFLESSNVTSNLQRNEALPSEKQSPKSLSNSYGRLMMIPIENLSCDPILQSRRKLNESVVREYLELMQTGEIFPPFHVVSVGNAYLLVDGYHRLEAAKLAHVKDARCLVHDGDRRQAILLSSSANTRHGLHRTIADKRKVVMNLLSDAEWREWSDHQIARHCGVSQPFVSGLRSKSRKLPDNVINENAIKNHRQRSIGIASELPQSGEESPSEGTSEKITSSPSEESGRARFIKVILTLEEVIREFDVTLIQTDPGSDHALSAQLRALARLIASKADILAHE